MTRKQAAESTYQAVLWVLRTHGVAHLTDNRTLPRLAEFSPDQMQELVAAMRRLQPHYPATVTGELIAKLEALR
jgi:hypothetical protein